MEKSQRCGGNGKKGLRASSKCFEYEFSEMNFSFKLRNCIYFGINTHLIVVPRSRLMCIGRPLLVDWTRLVHKERYKVCSLSGAFLVATDVRCCCAGRVEVGFELDPTRGSGSLRILIVKQVLDFTFKHV